MSDLNAPPTDTSMHDRLRVSDKRTAAIRQNVVDEALRLFLARGFEAVSMTELAEAAGISRRTLFRYFATKDDIVFQSVDALEGAFMRTMLKSGDGPHDPVQRLKWAYLALIEKEELSGDAARIKTRLIFDTPALARRMHQGLDTWQREFATILAEQAGVEGDAAFQIHAQVTAVSTLYTTAFRRWADDDRNSLREWVMLAFAALG